MEPAASAAALPAEEVDDALKPAADVTPPLPAAIPAPLPPAEAVPSSSPSSSPPPPPPPPPPLAHQLVPPPLQRLLLLITPGALDEALAHEAAAAPVTPLPVAGEEPADVGAIAADTEADDEAAGDEGDALDEDGDAGDVAPVDEAGAGTPTAPASPASHALAQLRDTGDGDVAAAVVRRLAGAGFTLLRQRRVLLTHATAEVVTEGTPDFPAPVPAHPTVAALTASPLVALLVEREGGVAAWRALAGDADAAVGEAHARRPAGESGGASPTLTPSGWSLRRLLCGPGGEAEPAPSPPPPPAAVLRVACGERYARAVFPPAREHRERTVVVVAPHAAAGGATPRVAARLEREGFLLLAHASALLTPQVARALLPEGGVGHEPFAALAAGPADAFLVERQGALWRVRDVVGATSTPAHAGSLQQQERGQGGGTNTACSAVLAAPTADAATLLTRALFPAPLALEVTLGLLLPGLARDPAAVHAVLSAARSAGFTLLAEAHRMLLHEDAALLAQLCGGPSGGAAPPPAAVAQFTGGPIVALALARPSAVKAWLALLGPADPRLAGLEQPHCLRAKLRCDGGARGLAGSTDAAAAHRALRALFPSLPLDPPPGAPSPRAYLHGGAPVCDVYDPPSHTMVPKALDGVLTDALVALAKARPSSSPAEAVRWLGGWLLRNNPRDGVVQFADGTASSGGKPAAAAAAGTPVPRQQGARRAPAKPASSSRDALPPAALTAPAAPAAVVCVVGPPGVGKTALCAGLALQLGYTHVRVSDLLRCGAAQGEGTEGRAAGARAPLAPGSAAADQQVVRVLAAAVAAAPPGARILLDGFPASVAQAAAFEAAVAPLACVLSLAAPAGVLAERAAAAGPSPLPPSPFSAGVPALLQPALELYAGLGRVRTLDGGQARAGVVTDAVACLTPRMVWVVGPPGAGKSAAAAAAAAGAGAHCVSVEALLAGEAAAGSRDAAELSGALRRGDAELPPATLVRLVRGALATLPPCGGRVLLDGAPASADAAFALEHAFGPPAAVIHVAVPDALAVTRCAARDRQPRALVARRLAAHHRAWDGVHELYRGGGGRGGGVVDVDSAAPPAAVAAALRAAAQPRVVLVVGGPGAGKRALCARLAARFHAAHVNCADVLRCEVLRGSAAGRDMGAALAAGSALPLPAVLRAVAAAVRATAAECVLLEGFPRSAEDAEVLDAALGTPDCVLLLHAPDELLTARLRRRAALGDAAAALSEDAVTGDAAIAQRLAAFREWSAPVVARYAARGRVRRLDAAAHSDVLLAEACEAMGPRVALLAGRPGAGATTAGAAVSVAQGAVHVALSALLRAARFRRAAEAGEGGDAQLPPPVDAEEAAALPTADALALVLPALRAAGSGTVLLQGFPRSLEDADALEAALGPPAVVLLLQADADTARARLVARDRAVPRGGGGVAQRASEREARAAERLRVYDAVTVPMLRRYGRRELVRVVPAGAGVPAAAVAADARLPLLPQLALLVADPGLGALETELASAAGRELGYATLDMAALLSAEDAVGGPHSAAIRAAAAGGHALSQAVVLAVVAAAVRACGARRVLLQGFERSAWDGTPCGAQLLPRQLHDHVFALEAAVGPVKGCVVLQASWDDRVARTGARTSGELRALRERVRRWERGVGPALALFAPLGKALELDTTGLSAGDVFARAAQYLQ